MNQTNSASILILACMAFLLGCATTQVPELDFLNNALRPVTLQGSIQNPITSKNLSTISIPEFGITTQNLNSLPGIRIALLDDNSQLIREEFFFPKASDPHTIPFKFSGRYARIALRIKIFKQLDRPYEIALGTIEDGSKIHDLGLIQVEKEALATRVLEQSSSYRILKAQDPNTFQKTRLEIFEKRIEPLNDWVEIASNIQKVGVDESGYLKVFNESYDPLVYKEPPIPTPWEPSLFDSLEFNIEPDTQSILSSEVSTQPHLGNQFLSQPKTIYNLIKQVIVGATSPKLILYNSREQNEPISRVINQSSVELEIDFFEPLSLEQRASLESDGFLHITRQGASNQLLMKDLNPKWTHESKLRIMIPFQWPQFSFDETHSIILQQSLQSTNPTVIPFLFFKLRIAPQQAG